MANYQFVIDSNYEPFSMQEMLVPLTAYKDAYEKSEERYIELADKADKFKYLSEPLPEDSVARKIYEGYAKDLNKQATDLAQNGLSMKNRRALTSMRRRYSGEIGRLVTADEAMQVEKKLRQSLSAQDSSRLYAIDNLSIDQFLDGKNPNLYNISGNELYTRGAAAGKAASARQFKAGDKGATLGGYYRDFVQTNGYSPEKIAEFRSNMAAIPELQMAADAILEERGVSANLTGANLQRARQSVINGIIDGAIYTEQHNPVRDLGKVSAEAAAQMEVTKRGQDISAATAREDHSLTAAMNGLMKVDGKWVENPESMAYRAKMRADVASQAEFDATFEEDPKNPGHYKYKQLPPGFVTVNGKTYRDPTYKSNGATTKVPLQADIYIDNSGITRTLGSSAGTARGTLTGFDNLPKEQQDKMILEDPKYYRYYKYYINGNIVTRVRPSETVEIPSDSTSVESMTAPLLYNNSNDNSLGYAGGGTGFGDMWGTHI